ncbi:MAG TPA: glycosyltransferase N-terminal domain-containing protein, partial [Desulfobacteraceae bacterium]|nr:glycosyltransferase N-terminal domain-containing protein [Desulfobacteraceae bacterium]
AFLAVELVNHLTLPRGTRVLITTTTAQGMEILEKGMKNSRSRRMAVTLEWFPFDAPGLMNRVVAAVQPKVMVLLETELWPGLLFALKQARSSILIINGRLSRKGRNAYSKTPWLWKALAPDRILAIDHENARRFQTVFPSSHVRVMKNIKFDSLVSTDQEVSRDISRLFPQKVLVSILASVRMEEEEAVTKILEHLMEGFPDQMVALFPRHLHRIPFWTERLNALGVTWQLRSTMKAAADRGTIVLWDRFGEQKHAFRLATTVFVGGSLKPLGGQNFIEPVVNGAATVTGPFLDNFRFAGEALFREKTAHKADTSQAVADFMINTLKNPPDRNTIAKRGKAYVRRNQGGTLTACRALETCLKNRQFRRHPDRKGEGNTNGHRP